jgi:hypothetical protein
MIGQGLSGQDLSGQDLSNKHLCSTNLSRTNLTDADLTGADLTGANLRGANLKGANLTGVDLTGLDLTRVDLSGAILAQPSLIALGNENEIAPAQSEITQEIIASQPESADQSGVSSISTLGTSPREINSSCALDSSRSNERQ